MSTYESIIAARETRRKTLAEQARSWYKTPEAQRISEGNKKYFTPERIKELSEENRAKVKLGLPTKVVDWLSKPTKLKFLAILGLAGAATFLIATMPQITIPSLALNYMAVNYGERIKNTRLAKTLGVLPEDIEKGMGAKSLLGHFKSIIETFKEIAGSTVSGNSMFTAESQAKLLERKETQAKNTIDFVIQEDWDWLVRCVALPSLMVITSAVPFLGTFGLLGTPIASLGGSAFLSTFQSSTTMGLFMEYVHRIANGEQDITMSRVVQGTLKEIFGRELTVAELSTITSKDLMEAAGGSGVYVVKRALQELSKITRNGVEAVSEELPDNSWTAKIFGIKGEFRDFTQGFSELV